jgi:hypothetical protein
MRSVERNGLSAVGSIHWRHADLVEPYMCHYARCAECGPNRRRVTVGKPLLSDRHLFPAARTATGPPSSPEATGPLVSR